MPMFDLENYVDVKERISDFWKAYPNGRIKTRVVDLDEPNATQRMVVVLAEIYKNLEDAVPTATGLAKEREGSGGANRTAFLENAETSAIGRAIANMGVATERERPSRQEMESVERNIEEHEASLHTIKELALHGSADLKKRVKERWPLLKESKVEAAKFLEEMQGEFPAEGE